MCLLFKSATYPEYIHFSFIFVYACLLELKKTKRKSSVYFVYIRIAYIFCLFCGSASDYKSQRIARRTQRDEQYSHCYYAQTETILFLNSIDCIVNKVTGRSRLYTLQYTPI